MSYLSKMKADKLEREQLHKRFYACTEKQNNKKHKL